MKALFLCNQRILVIAFFSFLCAGIYAQEILINEVVTKNSTSYMDINDDNPDWIELYNNTSSSIDLLGYGLSDSKKEPFKWTFSSCVLLPHEYLTVLASGKNLKGGILQPESLSHLMAWFSAMDIDVNNSAQVVSARDSFFVTKWFDSKKHYSASQNNNAAMPCFISNAVNGKPAVRFNGLNHFLKSDLFPPSGNSPRTIIVMLANADLSAKNRNSSNHIIHYGSQSSNSAYGISFRKSEYAGKIGNHYWGNVFGGRIGMTNVPQFITVTYDGNSDVSYVNGKFNGSNIVSLNTGIKYPLIIGSRVGTIGTECFSGDIAEIMIFDTLLSVNDRRQLENFLAQQYALPMQPFHTNFKLSDSGESLYLTTPNATLIASVDLPPLLADQSYGLTASGGYAYYTTPTYGTANSTEVFTKILDMPSFSKEAGLYTSSFDLSLSSSEPDVSIIYTLDGSEPDILALQGSDFNVKYDYAEGNTTLVKRINHTYKYERPIPISNNILGDRISIPSSFLSWTPSKYESGPNAMVVKAACYKFGTIQSQTVTKTFLIDPNAATRFHLPILSVSCSDLDLFDYETGIYVPGKLYDETHSQTPPDANFKHEEWERPATFEFFDRYGNLEFTQKAEMKIHGNNSVNWPRKSLRFEAKKKYGEAEFNYSLFPNLQQNSKIGDDKLAVFNSFNLRNSGNNWNRNLFLDAMIHKLARHLNCDVQDSRAVLHFLNGEYWGIMNLRERFDEYYFSEHYDMNPEDVIIANAAKEEISHGYDYEYKNYSDVETFVKNNSLSEDANLDYLRTKIDIDNYLTHFMLEIYVNNSDFLGNNRKIWRKRTSSYNPTSSFGHDGLWRWIFYDADISFQDPDYDRLSSTVVPEQKSTLILRKLLENNDVKNEFINLFCDNMNTTFLSSRVANIIDSMKTNMDLDMPTHIARWKNISLDQSSSILKNFAISRPSYMRQHLKKYFALSDTLIFTVNTDFSKGTVAVNSLIINEGTIGLADPAQPYPWSGSYFVDVPIRLIACPKEGYAFSHWSNGETNDTILVTSKNDITLTAFFVKDTETHLDTLIINEINYKSSSAFNAGDWVELYNPSNNALNISGWFFKDDDNIHNFLFPTNTLIGAKGYLVLCADIEKFKQCYPSVTNYIGEFTFGLGAKGDEVRIYNRSGILVDDVIYSGLSPWPVEANGAGATLELRDVCLDNSLFENWMASSSYRGTPGKKNGSFTALNEIHVSDIRTSIFPNPCTSEATILIPSEMRNEKIVLQIYNSLGMLLRNREYFSVDKILFSRENLTTGIYIVRLINAGNNIAHSMLIVK